MKLVDVLINYMKNDVRPIERMIIPANQRHIHNLKITLLMIAEAPSLIGEYHLFKNNCLTALFKVLKHSGYPFFTGAAIYLPVNMRRQMYTNLLDVYPQHAGLKILGATDIIDLLRERYQTLSQRNAESDEKMMLESADFWQLVGSLDRISLDRLELFWPFKWQSKIENLRILLRKAGPRTAPMSELLRIKSFPRSLYQLCDPGAQNCHEARAQDAVTIWSLSELKNHLVPISGIRRREMVRNRELLQTQTRRTEVERQLSSPFVLDLLQFLEAIEKQKKTNKELT